MVIKIWANIYIPIIHHLRKQKRSKLYHDGQKWRGSQQPKSKYQSYKSYVSTFITILKSKPKYWTHREWPLYAAWWRGPQPLLSTASQDRSSPDDELTILVRPSRSPFRGKVSFLAFNKQRWKEYSNSSP